MRKLLFLLAFIVVSCSSDDNSNGNANGELTRTNENLIGNWIIKGGTINGGEFENYENDCPTLQDYQKLEANGNVIFVGHNPLCEVEETENSAWYVSGNNLIIVNQSPMNNYTYIIESLTETKMILRMTYNDPDGVFTSRSHFERQ